MTATIMTAVDFFRPSETWNGHWDQFFLTAPIMNSEDYFLEPIFIKEKGRIVSGCWLYGFDGIITLFHLYTPPKYRRRGYAMRVVEKAKSRVDNDNYILLIARTIDKTPVYDLFEQCGFRLLSKSNLKQHVMVGWSKDAQE